MPQNREVCENCGSKLVTPSGSQQAPLYLFGAYPGIDEMKRGVPWIGNAGEVLKTEMLRAGISRAFCRMTNLWMHKPNDDERCLAWNIDYLLKDMRYAKAVLMMGALPAKTFTEYSVVAASGLVVKPKLFPNNVEVVMVMYNPASLLQADGVVGEVRLALSKFAELTREWRM